MIPTLPQWFQDRLQDIARLARRIAALTSELGDARGPYSSVGERFDIDEALIAARTGNVTGPLEATEGHIAVFQGPDGRTILDSGIAIDDIGAGGNANYVESATEPDEDAPLGTIWYQPTTEE